MHLTGALNFNSNIVTEKVLLRECVAICTVMYIYALYTYIHTCTVYVLTRYYTYYTYKQCMR